jgi:hypothetical protein
MMAKFAEAFRLLWRHLGLFTVIILTVWLPGNLLLDWVAYFFHGSSDTNTLRVMKASMWIGGIFGPLYIAALVYALFEIKSGRKVTYGEARAVGLKKWGPLFAARAVAGILILVGLVALIVPGVVLAVRYSLLDAVVVLEESKVATDARTRSTRLTSKRRWQIFGAAALFFPLYMVGSVILYLPLGFVEALDIVPVEVVFDCVLNIAYAVIQIVIFLFYWEAISEEKGANDAAPNGGPAMAVAGAGVPDGPAPAAP